MEVLVLNRQRGHRVLRDSLAGFLRRLIEEVPPGGADSVAVSLVSDRRMQEFNRRYRGRNGPTDVLSFPADERRAPPGERHLGDIVISVATAATQARGARHSLDHELKILALHGYLHLLGYDHESDRGRMMRLQRGLERRLLAPAAGRGAP